jgi:hypothetical protein
MREINSYQLWDEDRIAGEFLLIDDRQPYEETILRILHRILGCSVAAVTGDASGLFRTDQ